MSQTYELCKMNGRDVHVHKIWDIVSEFYHQLTWFVPIVQSCNDAQLKQLSKLSEIVHCEETHSDEAAGTIKITDLHSRNSQSLREHKHKQREHKQYLTHFALQELAFLNKLHPISKRHQN